MSESVPAWPAGAAPAAGAPAPNPGPSLSLPLPAGAELDVTIESLDEQGSGLGAGAGLGADVQVRVPFALPGERVRARVWRTHGKELAADLVRVTAESPHRVAPGCRLFGTCGGCQLQHLDPAGQLAFKTTRVRAEFQRHGLGSLVAACIPSPRAYGYRSKLTPHHEVTRGPSQALTIGFLRAGRRHALVDVPHCPLATDAINAALPALRAQARSASSERRRGASLLLRDGATGVTSDPDARVIERVGSLELEFAAREFFQNNPFLLPALVELVIDRAAETGAEILVDTYCGSGLFALSGARRFARVLGVEVSAAAVTAARANAVRNAITNVEFLAAPAASIFAGVTGAGARASVIVDPPRKGADASFLAQLVAFRPRTIVYVSCNPETAARDVARLLGAGYDVRAIQPFDMFPQTRHVECVTVLHLTPPPVPIQP